MRTDNYLSVCMFQLKVDLDCNSQDEFLIVTEDVSRQIKEAFSIIEELNPDISLFPEMAYVKKYDDTYKSLSKGRLIVAGSYYKNGINMTVVYQDGKRHEIPKMYASGAEPMARKISFMPIKEFLEDNLESHLFMVKGKKVYILNCMEYYHAAYYIARSEKLVDNLFGIFAICSNSNTKVFEQETVCIHNHNEGIYSFVLNCVGTYMQKDYADGKSYVYGPISVHEKEWLKKDGINTKSNVCHIFSLKEDSAMYAYGEYIFSENLSRFGRSDKYQNNPRNIRIEKL